VVGVCPARRAFVWSLGLPASIQSRLLRLAHVMRNGKSEQARAIASDKLLDRGLGKATQPVAGDKDGDAIKVESTVNMTDVAKLLLAKLGEVSS
jgi:hypothetical protein